MSLTNDQIFDLAKRMSIPLVFCDFKDQLATEKLQYNKSYILNMENEYDSDGKEVDGSHWCCFQINKYPNGKIQGCYMDSFGAPAPKEIEIFCKMKLPHNSKDIQSLMNEACGWYCLSYLYFINVYEERTRDIYADSEIWTELFNDLAISSDFKYNEYVLKQFFLKKDLSKIANPESISDKD